MARLADLLARLEGYGERPCLDADAGTCSYSDLLRELAAWRVRLDGLGVDGGQVIGVRADYSAGAVAALLALLERNAVAAMIPRSGDTQGYLREARAAGLLNFADDGTFEWVSHAPSEHPLLEQLRAKGEGGLVIFTSGTTSTPKAALQSTERFLAKFQKPGRSLRTLGFLLFDHVGGLDTLFYTLANGGVLVVTRSRDPLQVSELIDARHVEVLPASPSFLRLLCLVGGGSSLSSLKVITYGSEPMDASTLAWLNQRFPTLQIGQKYGTTETGSPRSVSRGNDSLWLRLDGPDVETKVVDGILWIRSAGTILGYLNAPSPLDAEGWYCTGDLVEEDGPWLRFRGRASDLINVGGEKVAPAEVEQVILALPMVREVVVTGEPNPILGKIVVARVRVDAGADEKAAAKAIRAHCMAHLARHKVPVKIAFVADTQVNERQKVQGRSAAAHIN